jgi:type VI secretion system secreted protein VgrG
MSDLKQEGRCLSIKTPLGDNVLVIQKFTLNEGISKPFVLQADLLSENDSITPEQLVGKRVTLTIHPADDKSKKQLVNGFVSRFHQGGKNDRVRSYHAEVVPWLWFLTQCRVLNLNLKLCGARQTAMVFHAFVL